MRLITSQYEPTGGVSKFDIFAADPMPHFNSTVEEWKTVVLGAWSDFVNEKNGLRMHHVQGNHSNVIKEPHVEGFQLALNDALKGRGM